MKEIYLDFTNIGDYEDFYEQLKSKIELSEHFDENIDTLLKIISENWEMPLHLEFVNMGVEQLEIFEDLLTRLEDAEDDVEGFSFAYYLLQYEDEA